VTGSLAPASVLLAFARDPGFPWPSHRATALGVVESVSPLRIAMFNPHHIAESPRVTQPVGPMPVTLGDSLRCGQCYAGNCSF
jgi:hypothetical protein